MPPKTTLNENEFAINDGGALEVADTKLRFSPNPNAIVTLIITYKLADSNQLLKGPTEIPETFDSCGVFTTSSKYTGGTVQPLFIETTSDNGLVYLVSDDNNNTVSLLTDGEKGNHPEIHLNKIMPKENI